MADKMIKIYGALEAATEDEIVTYSESVFDRARNKKLDEILAGIQTSIIPNPEFDGSEIDLIGLKINGVLYKIKDVGVIDISSNATTGSITDAQVAELTKQVCVVKYNTTYLVQRVAVRDGYKYTYISSSIDANTQTVQATHIVFDLVQQIFTVTYENSSLYNTTYLDTALNSKQETLVSGTNLKTFNGESLLGAGDIEFVAATNAEIDNLFKAVYTITGEITNGSLDGATEILEDATVYLTLVPDAGHILPTSIVVSGASKTYDNVTGIIILSNPTSHVTITATCPTAE